MNSDTSSPPTRTIPIFLLGDEHQREFRDAAIWLRANTNVTKLTDGAHALAMLRHATVTSASVTPTSEQPEVIIILQLRPGQFSQTLIESMRQAAPLARMVVLLGSWCEGETRTGRPLSGVVRVFWSQWRPRFNREITFIANRFPSAWDLPLTSSDADRNLFARPEKTQRRRGMIAISAGTFDTFEGLSDACRMAGYSSVWLAPRQPIYSQGADVVLCDLPEFNDFQQRLLGKLAEQVHPSPVLALIGFLRWEDRQSALAAGAVEVISKPLLAEDLIWSLNHARQLAKAPASKSAA